MRSLLRCTGLILLCIGVWSQGRIAGAQIAPDLPEGAPTALRQFDTDLSRYSIDLSELQPGGPSKDGIPSIDDPSFVSIEEATSWIDANEPVIALEHQGQAKAYPLQILTHHEIVNDRIAGTPVAVTFCPLCYSALVFERRLDGAPVTFGVSGLLRNSDLVMYDRQTESLWQQFTGTAIVGTQTGATLERLPAQIISFDQYAEAYPDGRVLSRETGYNRPYGQNPYAGYDDVDNRPFAFNGPVDDRLPPMEKVVAVHLGDTAKAYPHSITRERRVVHDTVAGRPLVIFHAPGTVSAVGARAIEASRSIGSTGVFRPYADQQPLHFSYSGGGHFQDEETGSTWTVTGKAVDGPLSGTQLERIPHGDYFSFAWFAFRPKTTVYSTARGR